PARARPLGRPRRRGRRPLPPARATTRLRHDVPVSPPALRFERSGYAALLAFLLFLYFPVSKLLDSAAGTAHVVLVLTGLAVFVGVYLSLMVAPGTPLAKRSEQLRLAVLL